MDDAAEHADALISKFSDGEINPLITFGALAVIVIVLVANESYGWASGELVVAIIILVAPQLAALGSHEPTVHTPTA